MFADKEHGRQEIAQHLLYNMEIIIKELKLKHTKEERKRMKEEIETISYSIHQLLN